MMYSNIAPAQLRFNEHYYLTIIS